MNRSRRRVRQITNQYIKMSRIQAKMLIESTKTIHASSQFGAKIRSSKGLNKSINTTDENQSINLIALIQSASPHSNFEGFAQQFVNLIDITKKLSKVHHPEFDLTTNHDNLHHKHKHTKPQQRMEHIYKTPPQQRL